MEVVADTSVLRQKYPLRGLPARYLRAFADHQGTAVIVPDVVVREIRRWVEDEVRKAFGQVRKSAAGVRKFGVSDALGVGADAAETVAVSRALANLDGLLRDLGAVIPDIPQGVTHEQVLDRLHSGKKPFTGTNDREKGYRDYLIWETILALGATDGERDENGRLPVAFLTANAKDFADDDGSLHPTLQEEAEARGVAVTLHASIDDFIDSVVEPTLPISVKANSLLEDDVAKAKIGAFIADEFFKFTPYSIDSTDHAYGAEMEDVTVEELYPVTVDYIEDVVDLPGGTAAAQIVSQTEARIDFYIWKADAYALGDDSFVASLSDWNDRYFLGEAETNIEGTFRVELEVVGGQLRPVSMDIVALAAANF